MVCVCGCAELGDSVAMSPVDRMRSLSLKLVSLGKIYAGTPRYFPLGTFLHPAVIRLFDISSRLFTDDVNSNIISTSPLPSLPFFSILYVSMFLWRRSTGSHAQ